MVWSIANKKDSDKHLSLHAYLPSMAMMPLKIRKRENIRIAKIPMMSVTGATLSKNVPANGSFNKAKPERIPESNKRIKRSILSFLLSMHYMYEERRR